MLQVINKIVYKTSAVQNTTISLTKTEEHIFDFIRNVCSNISGIMGKSIEARVAGGWIRDRLLGKKSKDIDITVNMKGDEFAQYLFQYGKNQNIVTEPKTTEERPEQIKNLSVAFLKIYGEDIEILPLRGNEIYEEGNRNPVSTEEATPEADAFSFQKQ